MKLVTNRMTVMSLTPDELYLFATNIHALEKELSITYNGEDFDQSFREIIKQQVEIAKRDEENYLWHTFWVYHYGREIIGCADFKNKPNADGQVEIGYGINKDFEGKGLTTEAVLKMVEWALRQEGVKEVIAETEKENIASQRVLEKCGFIKYKDTPTHFWWRVDMPLLIKLKEANSNLNILNRKFK